MGACMSSPSSGIEVSEEDKRLHREAEKALKEVCSPLSAFSFMTDIAISLRQAKSKMASQVKVGVPVSPNLQLGLHVALSGVTFRVRRLWKVHNTQGTCVLCHER